MAEIELQSIQTRRRDGHQRCCHSCGRHTPDDEWIRHWCNDAYMLSHQSICCLIRCPRWFCVSLACDVCWFGLLADSLICMGEGIFLVCIILQFFCKLLLCLTHCPIDHENANPNETRINTHTHTHTKRSGRLSVGGKNISAGHVPRFAHSQSQPERVGLQFAHRDDNELSGTVQHLKWICALISSYWNR